MSFTELKDVFLVSCAERECNAVFTCPKDTKGVTLETVLPCGHTLGYNFSVAGGLMTRISQPEIVDDMLSSLESEISRIRDVVNNKEYPWDWV